MRLKRETAAKNTAGLTAAGILIAAIIALTFLPGCGGGKQGEDTPPASIEEARAREIKNNREILRRKDVPIFGYEVIGTFEHGESAFTEGLALEGDLLYEGTGLHGQSMLTKTDLASGDVIASINMDPALFGEGVTVLGDEVFQLTYSSNRGFVYDKESFETRRTFQYPTQGWGLTDNGEQLIMSDGSSALHFIDPITMEETGYVLVNDNEGPVGFLNELEYVDGEIYANVWKTSLIAVISPASGEVTAWINLAGLNPDPITLKDDFVLNGIAYDAASERLLVTGKCWPYIYEIKLIPSPQGN